MLSDAMRLYSLFYRRGLAETLRILAPLPILVEVGNTPAAQPKTVENERDLVRQRVLKCQFNVAKEVGSDPRGREGSGEGTLRVPEVRRLALYCVGRHLPWRKQWHCHVPRADLENRFKVLVNDVAPNFLLLRGPAKSKAMAREQESNGQQCRRGGQQGEPC